MIRYVIFSSAIMSVLSSFFFFFFNDTATTEIYTLSLHDALPIYKRTRIYQCLACGKQFSATSGTIFNDTHLPLTKWFLAIAMICEAKKGMSANQLKRHLGVNYRTAWHLCHRIREAMQDGGDLLTGIVETDETYLTP